MVHIILGSLVTTDNLYKKICDHKIGIVINQRALSKTETEYAYDILWDTGAIDTYINDEWIKPIKSQYKGGR